MPQFNGTDVSGIEALFINLAVKGLVKTVASFTKSALKMREIRHEIIDIALTEALNGVTNNVKEEAKNEGILFY
ncbi:MAG: hypothetical protein ACRCXC_00780 [Legionella sp.]